MHFLIRKTLSFNLMYVAACYPVGTAISKTSSLFTALLQHYKVCNLIRIETGYDTTFYLASRLCTVCIQTLVISGFLSVCFRKIEHINLTNFVKMSLCHLGEIYTVHMSVPF